MIGRRTFLGTSLAALCGGGAVSASNETERLSVERVRVPVRRLSLALEGFRIVALSDFHLHPFTELSFLKRAVQQANALAPDLIVLLGDFVDATVDAIDELAPLLATLNARFGVWSILGNHDHRRGAARVTEMLQRYGLGVLLNRRVQFDVGGANLSLSGVDSLSGQFDLKAALSETRDTECNLLLSHEPDTADASRLDGRVRLQLSGHSHGGQVRVGGFERMALPRGGRKYPYGSYQLGELFLHTTRGLGTTGMPLRLGSVPEVTEVTLVAQE